MNLDVYNTHMELYPYVKSEYPNIESMYMATDKFSGEEYPCGFTIQDGKLYLPRGTPISKLELITNTKAQYKVMTDDPSSKMNSEHVSLYEPRDKIQEASIEFLMGEGKQLALNLLTAFGKTFCVTYASTKLSEKTIIILPNDSLKHQWIKTYSTMFDYKAHELLNITGSNIIDGIMEDIINIDDVDVFFVNHQTLHSYMMQSGTYRFHQFFKKLKVGIKVYDESHMNFGNILMIDFFTNTKRTWYITATFDRSDKSESICFKRAFQSVIGYGGIESAQLARKHVIYHVVNINSNISVKARVKLMGYPAFTAVKYGKYAFFEDPNKTAYKTIVKLIKKLDNVEGKILVFVPLIDAVDSVVKQLKKDIPEKSVAAYHSKIDKDEKESAETKDIIVSTIKSCGTGRDIKGLRSVICLEPVASKLVITQVIGRLRPYSPDKDTYFFDVCDRSILAINWWSSARMKKVPELVKEVIYLDINK